MVCKPSPSKIGGNLHDQTRYIHTYMCGGGGGGGGSGVSPLVLEQSRQAGEMVMNHPQKNNRDFTCH